VATGLFEGSSDQIYFEAPDFLVKIDPATNVLNGRIARAIMRARDDRLRITDFRT